MHGRERVIQVRRDGAWGQGLRPSILSFHQVIKGVTCLGSAQTRICVMVIVDNDQAIGGFLGCFLGSF